MLRHDFGFVLKTIEDLTVYDQEEIPHSRRVDEYLSDVNAYLNLNLWDLVKTTHPEIREFHVCCFLSDKSYGDGTDSSFKKKYGELDVWCGVDKKELQGQRFNAVRVAVLTTLLEVMGVVMRNKEMGGCEQLDSLSESIIDGIPNDSDRKRKAKQFLENYR